MRLLDKKLHTISRSKSLQLALFGIILGVLGVLSVFALYGNAYAAGGVGSGGSGSSGSGGTGNWSRYGWGWAIYNTSSSGPGDGFHNGTSWASVQATCNSAGASQVYAFIIDDDQGKGMVYDYQTVFDSPYQYAAHFGANSLVDYYNGIFHAVSVNTNAPGGVPGEVDAASAFALLPSKGVDTSAYSFGGGGPGLPVAWFCASFTVVHPPTPPSISATCNADGDITGTDANFSGDDPPVTIDLKYSGVNGGAAWPPNPPGTEHVVGIAANPDGHGYTEVTNIGGVFTFGDAGFYGAATGLGISNVVGIRETSDGGGYWLFASDGGVFAYGDAGYVGSALPPLGRGVEAIVSMVPTTSGNGYWLVSEIGRVWAYGDATGSGGNNGTLVIPGSYNGGAGDVPFSAGSYGIGATNDGSNHLIIVDTYGQVYAYDGTGGSAGGHGNAPGGISNVVSITEYPGGNGYWITTKTGSVYAEGGGGPTYGNPGSVNNIVGLAADSSGGYVFTGSDGGVFNYGTIGFYGSTQPSPTLLADTLNAGGGNSFSFNTSQYTNTTNGTNFGLLATNAAGQTSSITVHCNGVTNQPTATCGNASVSPTTVGLNQNFSYTANVNYSWPNNTRSDLSGYITVKINGITKNSSTTNATGSPLTGNVNNFSLGTVGVYSTTFSFTANSGNSYNTVNNATNCPGPFITVVSEPYFQVNGSDTSAGVGFCSISGAYPASVNNAAIKSWNDSVNYGASTSYNQGAGDQFGVFAPDTLLGINGYASSRGSPSPTTLSFANSGNGLLENLPSNSYGGGFGSSPTCSHDYYSDLPPGTSDLSSDTVAVSTLSATSGVYSYKPPTSLKLSGGTLGWGTGNGLGSRVILYVHGNVEITSDIKYTGKITSDPDNIPSFELIVYGNIKIDNAVSRLDGIYIAEPTTNSATSASTSSGIIFTCEALPSSTQSCNNKLTVNGALDANTIKLWRTAGSAGDGTDNDSAETIDYSPWVWLTQVPSSNNSMSNVPTQTKSIQALPPLL